MPTPSTPDRPGWYFLWSESLNHGLSGYWDGAGHWTRLIQPPELIAVSAPDDFVCVGFLCEGVV